MEKETLTVQIILRVTKSEYAAIEKYHLKHGQFKQSRNNLLRSIVLKSIGYL